MHHPVDGLIVEVDELGDGEDAGDVDLEEGEEQGKEEGDEEGGEGEVGEVVDEHNKFRGVEA